jgi:MATE family multidrug resistance protein
VVTATGFGIVGLLWVDESAASALMRIWVVTAGWIAVRAAFGVLRIWPGIGKAPLAVRA